MALWTNIMATVQDVCYLIECKNTVDLLQALLGDFLVLFLRHAAIAGQTCTQQHRLTTYLGNTSYQLGKTEKVVLVDQLY